MNKKCMLLHGATNCNSSNYGDFIYGRMVYDYLENNDIDAYFYQPSLFFKEKLSKYDNKSKPKKYSKMVFIPGGYFGEGHNARVRDNVIQFLRFFPIGIKSSFKKKKMCVLGIGAGPIDSLLMKIGVKIICNHSDFITTRDYESYQTLKNLCPKANIINAGDLIITQDFKQDIKKTKFHQIKDILKDTKDKKILLIHYNHSEEALEKFAKAANVFTSKYKNYYTIVASDSILKNEDELYKKFKGIFKNSSFHFIYSDADELSQLIQISDLIVTCKLHVGVVGCTMEKSVVSIACHPEKTKRFYKQIENEERCISLYESNEFKIAKLMEKYRSLKILISDELRKESTITWCKFEDFIKDEK